MKKAFLTILLAAVIGIGVSSLAGAGQNPLVSLGERGATDTTPKVLKMHRDPSMASERARGGVRLGYFVSTPQTVPANGSASYVARCLGRARVVDGGFNSDGYVYAEQLTAIDSKTYAYRVRDALGVTGTATFSITCIR